MERVSRGYRSVYLWYTAVKLNASSVLFFDVTLFYFCCPHITLDVTHLAAEKRHVMQRVWRVVAILVYLWCTSVPLNASSVVCLLYSASHKQTHPGVGSFPSPSRCGAYST